MSACGSSSAVEDAISRADQAAALAAYLTGENVSNPNQLPMSGLAIYAGFSTLNLPIGGATQAYVGDLDLQVTFGGSRDQVTGGMSNFNGLTGTLEISGGRLDRGTDTDVDYTFDGDVTGTLGAGADSYTIDAGLVAEFRGRNQDGVTGVIFGDINGQNGVDLFDGTLVGARTN